MFKRDRIKIERVCPPMKDFKRIIRYWDKAGTLNDGDWTVGLKMGEQHVKGPGKTILRLYWVLDVVRFREDATQREAIILSTAQSDGIGVEVWVEEEGGSGGKESAQNTVSNLAGFKVRKDKPVGDKALRADPASAQWNNYNFRLLEGPWNSIYLDEMEYFPFSTYMDQGDATSGAFAALTRPRVTIGCF
jgi:predicted phage terminase large subunit-like protein